MSDINRRALLRALAAGAVVVGTGGAAKLLFPNLQLALRDHSPDWCWTLPKSIEVGGVHFYHRGPHQTASSKVYGGTFSNPMACTRRCGYDYSPHGLFVGYGFANEEELNNPAIITAKVAIARMTLEAFMKKPCHYEPSLEWVTDPGHWRRNESIRGRSIY